MKADRYSNNNKRSPKDDLSLSGFTLIELLIAIAIASIITMVVYFSLATALDVWSYSSGDLAIQKVLSESIDEVTNGVISRYGLRDSLELVICGKHYVEFIPTWIDDTHRAEERDYLYTLNRRIKPGTTAPLGDYKLPETEEYRFITIDMITSAENPESQVRLSHSIPIASKLRFIYHPDAKTNPDVIKSFRWDSEEGHIYSEYKGEVRKISRSPFGVKITDMQLHYYDNNNKLITDGDWVDKEDINLITGIEVFMEAQLGDNKLSLLNFVSIPNAPLQSGYFCLTEETKIPIPDSLTVHTLLLKNFSGVDDGDILQLDAEPTSGKYWRIKIRFKRVGLSKAKIESYTIEYPIGHVVHTEYPSISIDGELNLLTIGPNGLYDYDDDEEIEDFVLLKGDVMLKVSEIDIDGVGLFVRP